MKNGWATLSGLVLAFLSLILFLFPSMSLAFRNLGTPVREALSWGAYAGPGKTGKTDTIYLSFAQYGAPLFLLAVNPDTGDVKQFNGPLSSEMGSWGFTLDHEKRIYLGSYYQAHLLRFDPRTEKWEDLGQPAGEKESFVCCLTTAPDGKIWGGTYPSANLFYYDPETGERENVGRMDPDQFYCYPTAGEDGLIYNAIQFEKTDIVVFDPKERKKISLIPPEKRKPGRVNLVKGRDGKMYAKTSTDDSWFRIEEGRRLSPVAQSEVPFPDNRLQDGRSFQLQDQRILKLQDPSITEQKEIFLNYDAAGSYIFVVGAGPDGRVYGSSMLPLRLFAYDPKGNTHQNLGKAAFSNGEIYSMGSLGDKLYLCSYPEGRLSVYNPQKPVRFGDQEDSNPRELCSLGESLYRPRTMVAGPLGRVFIGGYPDYGLIGGALGVYDPKTNEKRVFRNVVENQSIAALAYLGTLDLLAAGSSIRGGTGTHPVEKEAKLILWDPKEERKMFETVPVQGAKTILSLAVANEKVLYGITDNEKVFVFDGEKREIKKVFDLGLKNPREVSLQAGVDGMLYGLAKDAIFVIDPKNDRVSSLARPPTEIDSGMALIGRTLYYGSGANLWEFEIPAEPSFKPAE